MGRADYFKDGDWNTACESCGFKWKASKVKLTWDNRRCCPLCWEVRQPQDFVKGVQDNQTPPWTAPEPPDVFVDVDFPTPPPVY